jgi:aminomethyltransferase
VTQVADLVTQQPEVKPIGLGARDSLRLEAGATALRPRSRRADDARRSGPQLRHLQAAPRRGRLPGAQRIQLELEQGTITRRVV